jgi:hypothetical protein
VIEMKSQASALAAFVPHADARSERENRGRQSARPFLSYVRTLDKLRVSVTNVFEPSGRSEVGR